ncbi:MULTISPECIES: molecular chaperone HscC [unclassified Halomonas]|uniref:molecular chaperone HscC n=1 Tax=unclassified Halomonas TaxID=2609666 RepID=UPI0007D902EC|nr:MULTISPECIES: molecular chaperone HscC [unclassified Halomonas]MBT2788397.1 molecular chaperone HscC [Halomonas sp. ISL-106]MBT2797988.1 molecular chaperone HscC [Halomonas sp. ISL-104]OAL60557.1 molecular chaperone HscC [Halomonas sp. ALS9]
MAIIGIDLGTTNSACGVMTDDGVKLIPNRLGDLLTPSVVGLDEKGSILVGRHAKERLIHHADSTVASFKRLMGAEHKIKLGKKQLFSPVELSALVLKSLKEDAETWLGEPVEEAVISVPAYFNDNQRQATRQAGELVGLKVERLINEPTAASLAYGLDDQLEGTFLVLDMGGGTFDVSLIEYFDGVMEVHASAGDNFLGGEDFVEAMISEVLRENEIERKQLFAHQLQTLYMQMETVKRRISQQPDQTLNIQLGESSIEWRCTSEWFEKTCTPLLLRVKRPIEQTLRDAKISAGQIDNVILVGGSTRLSHFRSIVGRMFGRLPSCHLDPDTVVALGAAIQAGLKSRHQALDEVVLTDVCPYTLGTGILNHDNPADGLKYFPIIERNSTVPISIVRQICTAYDNQEELSAKIYQGEHRLVDRNVYLGELVVSVPKGPRGKEVLDIRFSYDMNGLLEVDATVVSTGKTYSKVIEFSPGSLSEEQKSASREKLAGLKFHPREDERNSTILARAERLYESNLGSKREAIADLIGQFERVLDGQNPHEIHKARENVDRLLDSLDGEDWL